MMQMISLLVKKRFNVILLALVLVFTGVLALTSADSGEVTAAESEIPAQTELSLSRPAALAVAANQDEAVFTCWLLKHLNRNLQVQPISSWPNGRKTNRKARRPGLLPG
jgi:hypothetical protein